MNFQLLRFAVLPMLVFKVDLLYVNFFEPFVALAALLASNFFRTIITIHTGTQPNTYSVGLTMEIIEAVQKSC